MSRENKSGRRSPNGDPRGDAGAGDQNAHTPVPLIYKFQTDRGRYAYDGNTNAIVKLDQITYELLDLIGTQPMGDVPESVTTRFPPDEVARSVSRLEALLNRSGVFHPVSIKSRLVSPGFVAQNWRRMAGQFDILGLEVTEDCNMRCPYCVYSAGFKNVRVRNQLKMPWRCARRALDFFLKNPSHQMPCQHVNFWGGEPLTNIPLIMRCVEHARSRDPSATFGMTTNGTLLNERVSRFLVAHDFRLGVSLDGPSEIHDQNRVLAGGKGTFEAIMGNLRALKESAPEYYAKRVRFECVVCPGVDFRKLLNFFANTSGLIGRAALRVSIVSQGPRTYCAPPVLTEFTKGLEALEEMFLEKVVKGHRDDGEFAFLRSLFEAPYLFIHRRQVNPRGWGETFHMMPTCFPGNFKLLVRANGKLLICEKCNDALEIGDIERGLDGNKICEIYRAFHDLHQNECRRCWALPLCAPCYVTDTRLAGTFGTRLDPEECKAYRQFWATKIRNYASVQEQSPGAFAYLNETYMFHARIPLFDSEPTEPSGNPDVSRAERSTRAGGATETVT